MAVFFTISVLQTLILNTVEFETVKNGNCENMGLFTLYFKRF